MRVIILTSFREDDKVLPAIRAGAQGYLLKDIQPNELVQAVREAFRGKTQLHPDIAQKLMSSFAETPPKKETGSGTTNRTSFHSLEVPAHPESATMMVAGYLPSGLFSSPIFLLIFRAGIILQPAQF